MRKNLLIFGGILISAGITTYILTQRKLAKMLQFRLINLKVVSIGLNKVELSSNLMVLNTTEIALKFSRILIDVYVNNVFVSKIENNDNTDLLPQSEANVPLSIQFNPQQILKDFKNLLSGVSSLNTLPIQLKIRLTVLKYGIPIVIPITIDKYIGDFLNEENNNQGI